MFEAFFLAALVFVVVLALRGKKSVILENPVIIHKVGLYHATLSPQLGAVQGLLEQIASQYVATALKPLDLAAQYFVVRDRNVIAEGSYLLAVGLRSGVLYFQAITDLLPAERYAAIHRFSEQVMVLHRQPVLSDAEGKSCLHAIVEAAAQQLNIACVDL